MYKSVFIGNFCGTDSYKCYMKDKHTVCFMNCVMEVVNSRAREEKRHDKGLPIISLHTMQSKRTVNQMLHSTINYNI